MDDDNVERVYHAYFVSYTFALDCTVVSRGGTPVLALLRRVIVQLYMRVCENIVIYAVVISFSPTEELQKWDVNSLGSFNG